MRVLFLTDGIDSPASRFRAEQFFPAFEERGIECTLAAGYGHLYNRVFERPVLGRAYKAACCLKRAVRTVASVGYDLLFVQRPSFPQSALAEEIRSRYGCPIVFDFDDAIWLGPGGTRSALRERAFRTAVRVSSRVIAGNRWLAERAGAPEKTTVIPSVVDLQRYKPGDQVSPRSEVVVGWMGSATNFPSVRSAVPSVLAAVRALPGARLRIVSNARLPELEGNPCVEQLPWSPEAEVGLLQSFDIGLMPLEDTESNRGKCGFKMIQYMAVGRPVVGSAVGANVDVLDPSAGFLVPPGGDWGPPLAALASDAGLRRRMGEAGRLRATTTYSVERVADVYVEMFLGLAGHPRRRAGLPTAARVDENADA